jgi:hypothetical protein
VTKTTTTRYKLWNIPCTTFFYPLSAGQWEVFCTTNHWHTNTFTMHHNVHYHCSLNSWMFNFQVSHCANDHRATYSLRLIQCSTKVGTHQFCQTTVRKHQLRYRK